MSKQLKIGLYARVSKQDQNLQTQLVALRDYCQRNNYEIVEEYRDNGISGSNLLALPIESEGFGLVC